MEMIEYGNIDANIVLIQPVFAEAREMISKEIALIGKDIKMIAVKVGDWNSDLSPWTAPAVFGNEDFGDGAEDTLNEILKVCNDHDRKYIIGGYSLAGLFALWAAYHTDVFSGVAAASPSMWFPGFTDHMRENELKCRRIYLSLGDREEKTKNQVMATVGDKIKTAYEILHEQGAECVLEWNQGNHFKDADIRTVRAFSWVLDTL